MPDPIPGPGEVLIRVSACGVCHTELDEIEGRTPPPSLPVILGHQVVGHVVQCGPRPTALRPGARVGVGWIYSACGRCEYCRRGHENLCPAFRATGRDANGGYAELMVVRQDFAYPIPESPMTDAEAAPLLCAGAIGYRSLRLANLPNGGRLGLTGFGASAHLVLKLVRHRDPDAEVFVFARSEAERAFAKDLGAVWAGDTADTPPVPARCDHRHHPGVAAGAWKACATSRPAAGWSSTRSAKSTPTATRSRNSTTPGTSGWKRK